MQTRSSSKFVGEPSTNPTSTNPRHRNRRRSKQRVEPFALKEIPIVTMADQRTMAELLRAPTEGYAEAIVVPPIPAEHFELKHSLINLRRDSAMTAILTQSCKPQLHFRKTVEESCGVLILPTVSSPRWQHIFGYHDNIQGYVSAAAVNYNQGNTGYRPPSVANQTRPPGFAQPYEQNNQNRYNQGYNQNRGNSSYQAPTQQTQVTTLSELEKFKKTNKASMQAMRNHIGNLKSELRNEMQATMSNQTNELKNMMASFFQMNTASSSGSGPLPSNTISNPKGELKAITTRSGIVLDGPSVPMPPPFINPKEDERVEETLTDQELIEYTIKVPPPLVQNPQAPSQKSYEMPKRDPLHSNISYPSRMNKEKQQDKDEIQIHKFWQMFKQLHINISLADALILILKYQKMLKALLSNKEKQRLELGKYTPHENCSDALADLAGIARDVFVPVGRFTFPADFVIVDYESDPRVPLILGRPFLRTARALIDVHGEELILCDVDERLILNMKHGTLKPNTLTSDLTSPEVKDDIFDMEGDIVLIKKFLNLDSTKDLPPSPNVNPLSCSTTSSYLTTSKISDYSLEEFADKLALIESFRPENDNMTPEDVIREIEYLLNRDPLAGNSPNNDLIYTIPEMFTDEHTLDYSSLPRYDDANNDLLTDSDEWGKIFYDDPFESEENKSKVSKLLVDELDSTGSSSFHPHFLECDSVLYEDFSEVDTLTLTDNEDKVFYPDILVRENLYEVTNQVTPDKNVKKKSLSNASLILEDYNPPFSDHELPFQIEIPGSETLLLFSSENEEQVFNLGILISKGVHSLLPELSHRDSKAFKFINIFESPMEIFPCSYGDDIRVLDIPWLLFYSLTTQYGGRSAK
ncbi:reverse transcriptase domain-containing protein [Tanacetum coccineum]